MAYPAENEVDSYRRYLIRYATGEETGPKLTMDQWKAKQSQGKKSPNAALRARTAVQS